MVRVSASVVNARWVKPLDLENVAWAATRHRLVVTIEENTAMGGYSAAVCEALADLDLRVPTLRLAVPDCFVTHGATDRLLGDIGLTPESVCAAVLVRLRTVSAETPVSEMDAPEGNARGATSHRRHTR